MFSNIKFAIINTISCMCNMTYEQHMNQPMQSIELRLNMIIANIPQLVDSLDRKKIIL